MRFSTIFAFVSLAAVASASTISFAEFSSNNSGDTTPVCYECAMVSFLKSAPSCQRSMLENINSEILLNDKGKACLCPVADLVTKPETLAACAGNTPYCSANFLNFTADIFSYIGKNNNCSTYGHAAVTSLPPATKESGANGFVSSNMMVVLGTAAVMTAASVLL